MPQALGRIEARWDEVSARAARRREAPAAQDFVTQTAEALGAPAAADPGLATALAGALVRCPRDAGLHNALGLAVALQTTAARAPAEAARAAVGYFRRALECDPAHLLAGLNLAEALALSGQKAEAAAQARRTLATLDRGEGLAAEALDAGHFPAEYDIFRVEWERAAWSNAGCPQAEAHAKTVLLRWRLNALLADLTGELPRYYEAAVARPDLPATRAALGGALARAGQFREAAAHLRAAVDSNPFDGVAARALFDALGAAGETLLQRRLAEERRLLAQAAPKVVALEKWFVEAAPAGDELGRWSSCAATSSTTRASAWRACWRVPARLTSWY